MTSITVFRDAEYRILYDHDIVPLDIMTTPFDERADQLTQEVRLVSPRAERHDGVGGLYLYDSHLATARSACFGVGLYQTRIAPLAPFAEALTGCVSIPSEVDVTAYAAYLHGSYRFSHRWELTAGLRYTHEDKAIDSAQVSQPADPAAAAALEAATGLPLTQEQTSPPPNRAPQHRVVRPRVVTPEHPCPRRGARSWPGTLAGSRNGCVGRFGAPTVHPSVAAADQTPYGSGPARSSRRRA